MSNIESELVDAFASQTITVTIKNGTIVSVDGIPEGVCVVVNDYDVEALEYDYDYSTEDDTANVLRQDEDGESYVTSVWLKDYSEIN